MVESIKPKSPKPAPPRDSEVLVLSSSKRSFQQRGQKFRKKKSGYKAFKMRKEPPKFCKKYKTVFLKQDKEGKLYSAEASGLPCDTWACPECQLKKTAKLKNKLTEVIKLNNLDHILTLTLDPKKIPKKYLKPVNRTGYYITELFNKYMVSIKRKMKRKLKYVWVKEFQKNKNAHLHVLFNSYLPQKLFRSEWVRIGGGHRIDVDVVQNVEAMANYVTSYLAKGFKNPGENFDTFRVGERRYSISQSCIKPQKNNIYKNISVTKLQSLLPFKQFWSVYNMLINPEIADAELILAPHQEELFKK